MATRSCYATDETVTRIGIVGAGLIGRRHIAALTSLPNITLAGVVDPAPDPTLQGPWVDSLATLLPSVDGVILAVPNHLHYPLALECIAAATPILVEKPLASTALEGAKMVAAAQAAGVPILIGHHRRHNPIIAKAHDIITSGDLGVLTTVHAQCWLPKPDAYFQTAWRQSKGAGPLFINLIHDVDVLMHLCGPITRVQAIQSDAIRGAGVEETLVASIQFASGLLGSLNLSDAAVGPWSWELTARENPAYPVTDQTCYWIGGTKGSLALPNLTHWHQDGGADWWAPMQATRLPHETTDPLVAQIAHFAAVIQGREQPLVSGQDGLRALKVVEALKTAAETGAAVNID